MHTLSRFNPPPLYFSKHVHENMYNFMCHFLKNNKYGYSKHKGQTRQNLMTIWGSEYMADSCVVIHTFLVGSHRIWS